MACGGLHTRKQEMTPEDLAPLKRAVQALEHPSFAARLANMVGKPIELAAPACSQSRGLPSSI
jgi:hypothetical protein